MNNILIATDSGNERLLKFPLFIRSLTSTIVSGGNGDGCEMQQFSSAVGVGLDSFGQIYVTDAGCSRLVKFPSDSSSSTSGTSIASINVPEQLFINPWTNDIYVASFDDHAVYKLAGGTESPVIVAGKKQYNSISFSLSFLH